MKTKTASFMILFGFMIALLCFSPALVSVVSAGFTPTPVPADPTNTPVGLPPTNTPVPAATNTPVPTSTPIPAATNTPVVQVATSTPLPTLTNTPASNSGSGSGGGGSNSAQATSTATAVVSREVRASVPENAPNIPALGEGYTLGFLLGLNAIFLIALVGLIFAFRAVVRAMRRDGK